MNKYDPKQIEPKWQKIWEDTKIYRAKDDPGEKKYILDYFPYPSGAGLSVGHVRNYTISDVYPRFKRMQGFNVLHPMGWDGFGLPAENYALKNKISPREATDQNKATYKRQMSRMGFSYDWDREVDSTDPDYYKWTQWFFLLLHKRGLAYQKESEQWWCDTDKTVLANEQVEAGKCWRCGNQVTKKKLKQWFFKITEYADRLIDDLDKLDWPEGIKQQQRNWIGRSHGVKLKFELKGHKEKLETFTTRVDTLAGATFIVLAPEHPMVEKLITSDHQKEVVAYIEKSKSESEVERMDDDKPKTGVFTGSFAINPLTGQEIPIWVADYVLMGYGTGAIMAVPAHDQRDYDFAKKFDLPIKQVIEPMFTAQTGESAVKSGGEFVPRNAVCAVVHDPKTDKYLCISWNEFRMNGLVTGGIEDGEDPVEAAKREVLEETGYKNLKLVDDPGHAIHSRFYHRQKGHNRHARFRYIFFELVDDQRDEVDAKEAAQATAVWKSKAELRQFFSVIEGTYLVDMLENPDRVFDGEGVLVNSGAFDGLVGDEAKHAITEKLHEGGKADATVNYRLRDWLISRQRYWGAPIPIIHCQTHGAVPVPEDQLPVKLPDIDSYEPSGDGKSPLARVESFVKTKCPVCGKDAERETDTMDGFACSSWYFLRFADPHNQNEAFSSEKVKYWLPVDVYIGGAEHAVMHLLYARFWTKVMKDDGLIDFDEPFSTLRNQGMILASDGRKMSKSFGNVITPDEVIEQGYGADALRLFEMFIAPYNQEANWQQNGLAGTDRFIRRVWTLVNEFFEAKPGGEPNSELETALESLTHKTIKKVTDDIGDFGFNTGVAALMEFVNEMYLLKVDLPFGSAPQTWMMAIETLIKLLAPFAPFVTEELWSLYGKTESIHIQGWPKYDPTKIKQSLQEIPVQVNGKLRGTITVAADTTEKEVVKLAQEQSGVAKQLEGKQIARTVVVPHKLINFVVN